MNLKDIELLNEIKRYARNNISCTAGVYCKNLENLRGIIRDNETRN